MRLKFVMTCTLILSAGALNAADDVRPIQTESAHQTMISQTDIRIAQNTPVTIANSATPTVASALAPAVMDAIATSDVAVQQVSQETVGNVCPQCGQVHTAQPQRSYSTSVRRPVRQGGGNMFGRMMDLERRKNAWLRGMWRR